MTRLKLDSSRRFLGKVWSLTYPYWQSEERGRAWGLLIAIIALTLGLVYIDVQFNTWNREFYNALEQKNYADFKDLILYFAFLAVMFIAAAIYKLYLTQMLTMRWRVWLTNRYIADWMDRQVYYRLELDRRGTDNPDQRIAEDLKLFTDGTLSLSLGLLSAVVTLVSFITILWTVSGPITLFGHTIAGYMVWAALIYAVAGSIITHYVGRPLIGLNFQQERYEADFRFTLMRLRENAEGVALYHGEGPEREGLLTRFERIRGNWWQLMRFTKRLTGFTAGYSQIAIIFPFIVAAPRYFSGAMPLGGLMQIASAFGQVQGALSWFVQSYGTLANWRASVDRLLTFHAALDATVHEAEAAPAIPQVRDSGPGIRADALSLTVPGSESGPARTLLADASFAIAPGERLLITGPSGSGKSTIFRALAGIWPFGRGNIRVPTDARVLFLPQKPYIPIGTLREAVSFPAPADAFGDEALREALRDCRLERFTERLEETQNWSMLMSGGEQQRLAVARALLHQPDFLFLDEATASMDESLERAMYELLVTRLPGTAITSIAHNPEVAAFHARTLKLRAEDGTVRLATA
ncbi:MAG: ABC transporter ATP-binding protein/permease [Betaproteobacteria bacterium]|nr:ABC transporter ATP-binding protein/permease [Betaproteobacteria bacterium]